MFRSWPAIAAGAFLLWAVPAPAQRPQARPVGGIGAIIAAFERFPVVAVGENHGDVAQHAFLRRLVSDPTFARAADAIVIEAGSARHQAVVDRFVAGRPVSRRALAASWRDSVGGMLGELAELVRHRYCGDLRRLREAAGRNPAAERRLLWEVKGVGDAGVDIFFRESRAVWEEFRPFFDKRARACAARLGLPEDPGRAALVGPDDLARLAAGLVRVELDGEIRDAVRARTG